MAKDIKKLLEKYENEGKDRRRFKNNLPESKKGQPKKSNKRKKSKKTPKEKLIKLDKKDKKLLSALDENARYTNTQLAKKVQLSKPAIEYRLNKYHEQNLIQSHYTIINFTKLGYSQYKIYFKFQNTSPKDEEKIINYWIKDSNSIWVAQIRGSWDLAVSILAKSNYEFGKVLDKFMNKHYKFILEKDILLTEYSPIYSKEYLEHSDKKSNSHSKKEFIYGIPSETYKPDKIDHKILKILSNNARINIIDLSEKTNLTRDIINYRIKKLKKQGIIKQYKTLFNLKNLRINHYKIIIRTKNFNKDKEEKIKDYIRQHKKATQFLKLIGSWDLEIEFETKNEDELYKILTEIRKEFSEIIRDYDIIRMTKTHKLNFYPF